MTRSWLNPFSLTRNCLSTYGRRQKLDYSMLYQISFYSFFLKESLDCLDGKWKTITSSSGVVHSISGIWSIVVATGSLNRPRASLYGQLSGIWYLSSNTSNIQMQMGRVNTNLVIGQLPQLCNKHKLWFKMLNMSLWHWYRCWSLIQVPHSTMKSKLAQCLED